MKSVIVWNASFHLASGSFKNKGANNSTIFNHHVSKTATRTSHLQTGSIPESKIQTGFNRTTTPWQNTFSLMTTVNGLKTLARTLCLGNEFTIPSSPWVFFPALRSPAPPLGIQLSIPNIQAACLQRGLPCRHLKYCKVLSKLQAMISQLANVRDQSIFQWWKRNLS